MFELLLLLTLCLNISSDIVDRRISGLSNPRALTLWAAILQLLLVCPFIFWVQWPGWPHVGLLLLVGVFSGFAREYWYRALAQTHEQLSRFVPFVRLSSVLVLALAILLLGETMTPLMAAGALLMIGAGFIISLERYGGSWREFMHANRALALVAVFATSNAFISVSYKYLLGHELNIITIYFFLKLFQCLPLVTKAVVEGTLISSRKEIARPLWFVLSRLFQTVAALVFLLVLYRLPLTRVEPLMALSPFLYLAWEWVERRIERRFSLRGTAATTAGATERRVLILRVVATGMTIVGLILLHQK
ncbi:MAG: EamA-like transporter family protein [Betaproteobacteria bacterium ADurb.Bin341]|nr:MAG: EamA-like transporter family protein [Betaproteobacteria bacterium ADurb.Bin341]